MRNLVRSAWALAIAGGMIAPALATAQGANKPVVAVFYFDNNSIGKTARDYDGIGKGMADMLITDLAANPKMVVVDRDKIQTLLAEQKMTKEGTIDAATAVRLGKIIGAQYAITGGFISDGKGKVVLTARAISMETSAIMSPQKVEGNDGDVLALISQLSDRVRKDMNLPAMAPNRTGDAGAASGKVGAAAGAKPGEVAAKSDKKMDLKTAMLYSKALEEADNGNNKKAVELYQQVLDKFPDYAPAQQGKDKAAAKSGK